MESENVTPGMTHLHERKNQEAKKSLIGWDARTEMSVQPNKPTEAVIQSVEHWEQAVHHHQESLVKTRQRNVT